MVIATHTDRCLDALGEEVSFTCPRCKCHGIASSSRALDAFGGICPICVEQLRAATSSPEGYRDLLGGLCPACLASLDQHSAGDVETLRLFAGLHPFCGRASNAKTSVTQ